jgi:hypothetical protein
LLHCASAPAAWPWPPLPPLRAGLHCGCPSPSEWSSGIVRSALGPVGFVYDK